MKTQVMIEVLQAFDEGKKIQFRFVCGDKDWQDTPAPMWDFGRHEYRVEPSQNEIWIAKSASFIGIFTTEEQARDFVYNSHLTGLKVTKV